MSTYSIDCIINQLQSICIKPLKKGSLCSINGKKYEIIIYNIIKKCIINKKNFNIQNKEDLGGSKPINDLVCIYNNIKIGIEIKKCKTPDWMQMCIKYNQCLKKWEGVTKCKIPIQSKEIFNKLINNIKIFNNELPPFIEKQLTYDEWIYIKKNTNKWNDMYIDIPTDTIRNLYSNKGCYYIQISEYGLYHLGNDICNFGVPIFDIDQQIRIRIKVHSTKNKNGFCKLSITISCKPKNIKILNKSSYSLDNINKLPNNLYYIL